MLSRPVVLLFMLLALLTPLMGCGGGGGAEVSTTVTTTTLSKAAYIARAGKLCAKAGERMLNGMTSTPADGSTEAAQMEELSESVLRPDVEMEIGELRELGAPAGDEKQIEAFLAEMQAGLEASSERPITSLEAFGIGFRPFDRSVKAYGLKGCAFGLA